MRNIINILINIWYFVLLSDELISQIFLSTKSEVTEPDYLRWRCWPNCQRFPLEPGLRGASVQGKDGSAKADLSIISHLAFLLRWKGLSTADQDPPLIFHRVLHKGPQLSIVNCITSKQSKTAVNI